MKRSTKGFYTLEAAICLPFVLLAVLSLGYFMRIDGMWENCIHGAVDESALAASKAYGGTAAAVIIKAKSRMVEDNPDLDAVSIGNVRLMYSDGYADQLISYRIEARERLRLPLGFEREFHFSSGIKFRGFIGKRENGSPMGSQGLEQYAEENPVYIFPHSGEKYHAEGCTYVKASVAPAVLTDSLKSRFSACGLCGSKEIPSGSVVFCFKGEDTAYHRGTCSSINRHTVVIDRTEAVKRGYGPCSKCGGG